MIILSKLGGGLRRTNHAACAVAGHIYVFGGFDGKKDYSEPRPIDIYTLNMSTLRWEELSYSDGGASTNVPCMRHGHTVVDYGHLIYLWGGRRQDGSCNKLFIFDTISNSWLPNEFNGTPPGGRDGHAAIIAEGYMYIFGGFDEDRQEFCDTLFRLEIETRTWSQLVHLSTELIKKDFCSCVLIGNKIYVYGGRSYSCPFYDNRVAELDLTMMTWSAPEIQGYVPPGRRSHSSVVVGGKMVMFGGYNDILDCHYNDFHIYNPETYTWTLVKTVGAEPPCPRRRQCCVAVNDFLYIFGGTCPINKGSNAQGNMALMELDDLIIVDTSKSLRSRSLFVVLDNDLNTRTLTTALQREVEYFRTENQLSNQLANLDVDDRLSN